RFSDFLGDRLSVKQRALYERFLAVPFPVLQRQATRRNLSIVHGDSHVWNVLLPRSEGATPRLFDFDFWRPGLAATDLAYMMAVPGSPERRRQFGRPLLAHYPAPLGGGGVRAYARRSLDDDYRLAALMHLATPLLGFNITIPPLVWWNQLQHIT